jgi:glycosyltransferase involved in cell wall biosynthesis
MDLGRVNMKVLLVTNMYPTKTNPFYGIFVREQVESLRNENVLIDVFFINGQKNRFNYLTSIIALIKKFSCQKYDIIHAHHTYCIYPIKIATAVTGVKSPLILTFHEGEVHRQNGSGLKNIDFIKRLVFSKRLKRIALKMVDLVIAVQAEMLKRINFNGKSVVLPCGVNSEMFRPLEKKWCREKLGLPLDKKIVFFPASPANKQKGFDLLKESLRYLNRPDLQLVAGGNLLHSDMPYYMNAADVVVQLSVFEASPSVLKEALAANVPVVFTDAGDAKMLAGNVKGCFLCERRPKDVASKLDEALRFDEICTGRERIFKINLTQKAISKKLIKMYNDLAVRG